MKTLSIAIGALIVFSGTVQAEVKTETVEYGAGDTTLKGYLAYDDALDGKAPAVIVVHEWWGLGDHARKSAERLAARGIVALAVDMYGDGKLTDKAPDAQAWSSEIKNNPDLGRERFEAALNLLRGHERVDGARIGAMGYCFGGTVVLEMARAGLPLKGVVSFHGGLKSNWPEGERKIDTSILVCHGADDPFVSDEEVQGFIAEMRAAGADWQFIHYGNAVHSFTNPEVDQHGLDGARYDKKADERSWRHMEAFFDEVLK